MYGTESLLNAFNDLQDRYQIPLKPMRFGPHPDFQSITKHDPRIVVNEIGPSGSWPNTDDAIMQFKYQPTDTPYTDIDGFQRANYLDVFCLVADLGQKLIIDTNGEIRSPGAYGNPVAWASYRVDVKQKPTKETNLHKMLKGETIWSIATRFKVDSKELIEHNDIDDPSVVPEGTVLHLPLPKTAPPEEPVRYEIFPVPRIFHVKKPEGARKYSFGNVKKWKDITSTGVLFRYATNIEIAGIAHVPVEKEVAAYYMDALNVGDYQQTGRVRHTLGFNWQHLEEGEYTPPEEVYIEEEKPETFSVSVIEPEPVLIESVSSAPVPEPEPIKEEPKGIDETSLDYFKTTYLPFANGPVLHYYTKDIVVKDYDGRHTSKTRYANDEVWISGTFFVKDDAGEPMEVGRPSDVAKAFMWYGIPMKYLQPEDELYKELYNSQVDIRSKLAMHSRLSLQERGVVALARTFSNYNKVKQFWTKNKK